MMPEAEDMIGWLQEQFDDKAVEAHLDGVGALQLSAVQTVGDLSITIRCRALLLHLLGGVLGIPCTRCHALVTRAPSCVSNSCAACRQMAR